MRTSHFVFGVVVAGIVVALGGGPAAQTPNAAGIYARECASCHNGAVDARTPSTDVLRKRSPEAIMSALTAGGMRPQGARLSGAERRAIAEYLTGRALGGDVTGASTGRCAQNPPMPAIADLTTTQSWTGWSPVANNTRLQSAEAAGLTAATVPRLTLAWAIGFPDATSAWSQPTVAGGRLFVGSQNGTVYALDAKSGCIFWAFTAATGVRTSPTFGPKAGGGYAVFFGDAGGNVYAVDASSGAQLWTRHMDEHPHARITGSPTLHQGHLYVPVASIEETAASQAGYECCTFRGSVSALDAATGKTVWQWFTIPPAKDMGTNAAGIKLLGPSGVGIWSAPTIDAKRSVVYVGTGNTYSGPAQPTGDAIVALDLNTGAVKWIKQMTADDVFGCRPGGANCGARMGPDFDFGTPAMLATLPDGHDLIVVGQKSGMTFGLDPDKEGAVLWQYRAGQGSIWGGVQWGAAADATQAYFPVSDIRTPAPGGLHAVKLATGERAWYQPPPPLKCAGGQTCNAALISAPTLIPGVLFSGSNDGALRAHSTADGSVLWEFDTNREFTTLNGVTATGGSIQGPGPAVAGGMLYINAGYGDHLGRPGNVLLAFKLP